MKKALFVAYSYHHFLVAVAKTYELDLETDIVFSNLAFEDGFQEFSDKVRNSELFKNVFYIDERKYSVPSKKKIFKYYYYELVGQKRYFDEVVGINLKTYDDIYLFSDVFTAGAIVSHEKIKYHLLEDTMNSFSVLNWAHAFELCGTETFLGKLFYLFNFGHMLYGNDKNCLDIEISEISDKLPPLPKEKIHIVNRKQLIKSIPQEQKKKIINLFNINFNTDGGNCALVLTQPLCMDNKVKSFEEQISIYKNLIEKYLKGYLVVIKPHPRDKCDYSSFNVMVIEKNFPVEILEFFDDIKIKYAISIYSTAVNGIDFAENKLMIGENEITNLLGCN